MDLISQSILSFIIYPDSNYFPDEILTISKFKCSHVAQIFYFFPKPGQNIEIFISKAARDAYL